MKSTMAMTNELLDMRSAARDLLAQIADFALEKNTLGLLYCDSELDDHALLLRELRAGLDFELIGCTSVASFGGPDGVSEMSISLLVLTADDCRFRYGLSGPISRDNVEEEVRGTWRSLGGGEHAVMLLCHPPYDKNIMMDLYPQMLGELSGGLPLFGGLPGYNEPYGINAVIAGERYHTDRMLLVLIEGEVRPVFSMGIALSHIATGEHTVTRAAENVIYEVDGEPFTSYLDRIGLDSARMAQDETNILFVANPMLLTDPARAQEERFRIVRALCELDIVSGYGVAIGRVPQGHRVAIGSLTRRDISASAENAAAELLEKIAASEAENPGYRYSTVLATSCIGRYMVLTPRIEVEGRVLADMLPEHLTLAGYYGYGEFGPTSVHGGRAVNTSQNESLVLCAF